MQAPSVTDDETDTVTESELLWNSTPTFIHRLDGRNFQEPSECKHLDPQQRLVLEHGYETLRSTLENGTLDPKHLGKGSTYGCPYPDGVEVDEVASRLYGA